MRRIETEPLQLQHLEHAYTMCRAVAGSHLDLCRREAALVAVLQSADVHFIHNDVCYIAKFHAITDTVMPETAPKKAKS
jgi:hypothetical protein